MLFCTYTRIILTKSEIIDMSCFNSVVVDVMAVGKYSILVLQRKRKKK